MTDGTLLVLLPLLLCNHSTDPLTAPLHHHPIPTPSLRHNLCVPQMGVELEDDVLNAMFAEADVDQVRITAPSLHHRCTITAPSLQELWEMINKVDKDCSGAIEWQEFLGLMVEVTDRERVRAKEARVEDHEKQMAVLRQLTQDPGQPTPPFLSQQAASSIGVVRCAACGIRGERGQAERNGCMHTSV